MKVTLYYHRGHLSTGRTRLLLQWSLLRDGFAFKRYVPPFLKTVFESLLLTSLCARVRYDHHLKWTDPLTILGHALCCSWGKLCVRPSCFSYGTLKICKKKKLGDFSLLCILLHPSGEEAHLNNNKTIQLFVCQGRFNVHKRLPIGREGRGFFFFMVENHRNEHCICKRPSRRFLGSSSLKSYRRAGAHLFFFFVCLFQAPLFLPKRPSPRR